MTTISLVSAIAVRENIVRVGFDSAPYYSGVLDPGDASDLARWSLAADSSSIGRDGEPARVVAPARVLSADSTHLDVWVDRRFSPFPARYRIFAKGLLSADLSGGLVVAEIEFFGVQAGRPAPSLDAGVSNADIANPQTLGETLGLPTPGDAALGTYPTDDTGDIANERGLASYKKRVIRRLTTRKGAYAHLPDYGTLLPDSVKALARPDALRALCVDAEAQIREEPETVRARVTYEARGGIAYFRVRARCSFGSTVDLAVPVTVA